MKHDKENSNAKRINNSKETMDGKLSKSAYTGPKTNVEVIIESLEQLRIELGEEAFKQQGLDIRLNGLKSESLYETFPKWSPQLLKLMFGSEILEQYGNDQDKSESDQNSTEE